MDSFEPGARQSMGAPQVTFERVTAAPPAAGAIEHLVAMRDGVRLATDIYLCDTDPAATVLVRTPYDKAGDYTFLPQCAAYFNEHGYHVVVQDVRGKFGSQGETRLFVHEGADGYDTIDWTVSQPWSNGIVGMWGDSYYGFTQLAAAGTGHPALRAIAPRVTGTRLGELSVRAPLARTSDVEMGIHRLYPVTHFQSNDTYFWDIDWASRPYAAQVEEWFTTIGHRSTTFDEWMPYPDGWDRFPDGHPFDARAVPILQTIGFWDNCAPWQWSDHKLIAQRPEWAAAEYLRLEAIDHECFHHGGYPLTQATDHASSQEARRTMLPRYIDPALAFFDVFLRGIGDANDIARVTYEVAGERGSRAAECWPPANTSVLEWCLASNGQLIETAIEASSEATWVHDPTDPVPSPAIDAFAFLAEYPDERSLADRADVLSFSATPVDADVRLVGPVSMQATVSSSGPEMDLFARLTDVSPAGDAHLIARGQVTLYEATDPIRVSVDMGHTAYRLAAGHHLRLTIASSDAPEFVPAPGNGEHRWLAASTVPNIQRIILGGRGAATLTISSQTID
jgi:uncharacterized protein